MSPWLDGSARAYQGQLIRMSATQEKKKLNPGDLVRLKLSWYGRSPADTWGMGLYLGDSVYWFKSKRKIRWRESVMLELWEEDKDEKAKPR